MKITPGNMAALSYGVGGIAELASGFAGMRTGQARANYQRTAAGINRDFARMQGADVRERGEKAARKTLADGRRIKGAQRAAMAAQGVDVATGSAADLQAETDVLSALDANEIRSSAWMQAWGIEANADNEYAASLSGASAVDYEVNSTLAVGGLRALSQWGMIPGALDRKRGAVTGQQWDGKGVPPWISGGTAMPAWISGGK